MAFGDVVAHHEEIVRSLYEPLYASAQRRPASNAFCQVDASVSRTAVLPYEEIMKIFKADREGFSPVVATCTVLVGDVIEVCKLNPKAEIDAQVVEKPERTNVAHAEIRAWSTQNQEPRELKRGMSKELLRRGTLRPVD